MDYILFNIDNGDVMHLGRALTAFPNEALGLTQEHFVFQYIPDIYRATELLNLKDTYLNFVHALSFFLQTSRHCKLTVLPIHEFDEYSEIAMKQLKNEGKISKTSELYHGPMFHGNYKNNARNIEHRMLKNSHDNKNTFAESPITETNFAAEIIESIKLSILSSPVEGHRIEYSSVRRDTLPSLNKLEFE